jgi:cell division protein FtsL
MTITVFYTFYKKESLYNLISSIVFYMAMVCILYLFRNLRSEKEEVNKLNGELMPSNAKLQDYSLKVEELTVARERIGALGGNVSFDTSRNGGFFIAVDIPLGGEEQAIN